MKKFSSISVFVLHIKGFSIRYFW